MILRTSRSWTKRHSRNLLQTLEDLLAEDADGREGEREGAEDGDKSGVQSTSLIITTRWCP